MIKRVEPDDVPRDVTGLEAPRRGEFPERVEQNSIDPTNRRLVEEPFGELAAFLHGRVDREAVTLVPQFPDHPRG